MASLLENGSGIVGQGPIAFLEWLGLKAEIMTRDEQQVKSLPYYGQEIGVN